VSLEKRPLPVIPGNFYAAGLNYRAHIEWANRAHGTSYKIPERADIGYRSNNALIGSGADIVIPRDSSGQVDFEGELVAVIGRRAKNVSEKDALDYVAGYTIMNDVSARCLQAQGLLTISKGFETFCPIGPCMVTKDEIPDPQNLTVRTYLNDLEVCKAHTSEMLFTIRQFIAALSRVFPLEPGDVLATGSPPGPGMYHDPPILAKVGDVMRIEVEKIGTLANPVVAATR
jgi:2-keto-4-pentenoate hydratase/2-oxohepta-3-ene-1,7-dioic acid hydratase in catechol pathway